MYFGLICWSEKEQPVQVDNCLPLSKNSKGNSKWQYYCVEESVKNFGKIVEQKKLSYDY